MVSVLHLLTARCIANNIAMHEACKSLLDLYMNTAAGPVTKRRRVSVTITIF